MSSNPFADIYEKLRRGAGKKAVGILVKGLKLPGIVNTIAGEMLFPEATSDAENFIDWDKLNRDKLIQDALDALKKLPKGKPTYKNNKPVQTPPKNTPKTPQPTQQPPFKLPPLPNTLPFIDPFILIKPEKRTRPISGRSATKLILGQMECHPISYTKEPVFNVVHDIIGTKRKTENAQKGAENFMKWMVRENGNLSPAMVEDSMLEGGGGLYGDTLWDQCAVIAPQEQGKWTGKLSMQFGAASIADDAADCSATRQNVGLGGIRPVIYWNKPKINVRQSGNVDISERLSNEDLSSSWGGLAASIKTTLEHYGDRKIKQLDIVNNSHGGVSKKIGVGVEEYAPLNYVTNNRDPQEEVKLIDLVIDNYEKNMNHVRTRGEKDYLEREIDRLKKEKQDVLAGKKFKVVKTLSEKVDLYADLTSQILGHWPILIEFQNGTLITQTIEQTEGYAPLKGDASFEAKLKQADPQNSFKVKNKGDVKVNFPNLSEAIADLTGLLMDARAEQALMKEIIIRLATESCSNKNIVMEIHDHIDAINDFLGFGIEYQKDYHIIPFNPTIIQKKDFADYEFCIGKAIERRKPLFKMDKEHQTLIAKLHAYDQASSIIRATLAQEFTGKKGSKFLDSDLAGISPNQIGIEDPKQYFSRLAALHNNIGRYKTTNPANIKDGSYSFQQRLEAIKELLKTKNKDGTRENDGPIIQLLTEPVELKDGTKISVGNVFDKQQLWSPSVGRISK